MSTATEHQVIAIIPSLAHSTVPDGTGKYGKVTHNVLYILLCLCIDIPCYNTPYVLLFSSVLLLEGKYNNSICKLKLNIDVSMYIFSTYGGNIREYVGWLKGHKQQNGTDW